MSGITTHILDVARGRPAADVTVVLSRRDEGTGWEEVGSDRTDDDGRAGDLLPGGDAARPGVYRIRFEVGAYFRRAETEAFYPHVDVVFRVENAEEHYHVPVLLGPYGYTTYRGS